MQIMHCMGSHVEFRADNLSSLRSTFHWTGIQLTESPIDLIAQSLCHTLRLTLAEFGQSIAEVGPQPCLRIDMVMGLAVLNKDRVLQQYNLSVDA